jgi:hypothetical protein
MRLISIRLSELAVVVVARRVRVGLTCFCCKGRTLLLLFLYVSLYLRSNSPVLIVRRFGRFLGVREQEVSVVLGRTTFLSRIGYRLDP